MASSFIIKEHKVEGQHIREYSHATANSQEEILYLSVKQYIPKSNPNPQPGDLTIIGAHANGFVKELYEPLWEDLIKALATKGIRVRSIFIADAAWQGQSSLINESSLGNDPSWYDHPRDLLCIINALRREMPRPLVGIGHSFGGNTIVTLSLLHPRLFSSLVLLDPVISKFTKRGPTYGFMPMKQSAYRRDVWPSRKAAAEGFKKNKFYQTWDPRCLDVLIRDGLRLVSSDKEEVTLTTTKHQECFTYYRPKKPINPRADLDLPPPDLPENEANDPAFPFYRAEGTMTTHFLPHLRPGVLWVFGEKSDVCPPESREEKLELTGTGWGGSGGVKAGRVEVKTVEGYGHLVPMEATIRCAQEAAEFIVKDLEKVWRKEDEEFRKVWKGIEGTEKRVLSKEFLDLMGPPPGRKKPAKEGAKL
ncbi:Alpha/beta hydrolase family-domain-containing protein [Sordaria brevicollis]|uniref:Alpha/beta hydrolase family-domain-containing protein n=1 Tax=Sordaria brevicollis TaxID=83679 RepID=A0AAE0UG32_SORBR|nr:Alpha/beta hydrolase family-domain-containing protein [Sordaria brevicollis]